MYCRQCGAEIRQGAAFCPKCGTPTGTAPAQTPTNQPENPASPKKRNFTPLIALVILVLVLVVGVLLIMKSCSSGKGYSSAAAACEQVDDALDTLFTADSESDIEKACEQFVAAMPAAAVDELKDYLGVDDDADIVLEELFYGYDADDVLEMYEDYFGVVDDLKLSFTSECGDRLDSDDLDDIQDDLDYLDVDLDVDAAYEIEVSMSYSYTYDGEEVEDDDYYLGDLSPLILIRVDDTWYLWFSYL